MNIRAWIASENMARSLVLYWPSDNSELYNISYLDKMYNLSLYCQDNPLENFVKIKEFVKISVFRHRDDPLSCHNDPYLHKVRKSSEQGSVGRGSVSSVITEEALTKITCKWTCYQGLWLNITRHWAVFRVVKSIALSGAGKRDNETGNGTVALGIVHFSESYHWFGLWSIFGSNLK